MNRKREGNTNIRTSINQYDWCIIGFSPVSLNLWVKTRLLGDVVAVNESNPQKTADLVTFAEEILNGKLHFCAVIPTPSCQNLHKSVKFMVISTANIYLFKVNNRNISKSYEICWKLTIKTPERHHWLCSGFLIVNSENTSHFFLVSLLLILSIICLLSLIIRNFCENKITWENKWLLIVLILLKYISNKPF